MHSYLRLGFQIFRLSQLTALNLALHLSMSFTFLVTGSGGFLGSALIDKLSRQHNVIEVSRSSKPRNSRCIHLSRFLEGSSSVQLMKDLSPDYIIHCAAIAHQSLRNSPSQLRKVHNTNVTLSKHFAELADCSSVKRFIFISSIGVHGPSSFPNQPIHEISPILPSNIYSLTKYIAEQELHKCFANSSCDLTILRPSLVYGPGVPGNLRLLQQAVDLELPFPLSNIQNKRSFVYIGNLVDSIIHCCFHPKASFRTFVVSDKELYPHLF